ncbi:MAG: hypothetical protein LBB84_11370 [Tannerellaceae bacterium]|jgi:hypothetical protein|nr:hypothetical protein [Tannerellaceae bacterium]
MKKNIFLIVVILFCLIGCRKKTNDHAVFVVNNAPRTERILELKLDSFLLESIESSYVGDIAFREDIFYFIDKKFCWVFTFNQEGSFVKRYLGRGQGPGEIAAGMIDGYAFLNDKSTLYIGPSNDCYIYDKNFVSINKFVINKGDKNSEASYNAPWIYTLMYENLILKNYKNYLYYTIYSERPSFNFIESPEEYFEKVHILSKLNLETGIVEEVIGQYPPIYREDKSLKQFNFIHFDIDNNGKFYISFEADSLIYQYDENFKPLDCFGFSGKNMGNKSRVFTSIAEFQKGYIQNRKERGYYKTLTYIEETGLLFRSYYKGEPSMEDGLQIYENNVLIGDIQVPSGFSILGYSAPYYYAINGVDEDNEKILIYKFKI